MDLGNDSFGRVSRYPDTRHGLSGEVVYGRMLEAVYVAVEW